MNKHTGYALLVAVVVLIVDQLSKWVLFDMVGIAGRTAIEVTSFFNLVMVWNPGISFGMLADYNQPLLLIIMTLVITAFLLAWLVRTPYAMVAYALGAVIGGAAGNCVDRLRFGAVADFFDFHLMGYHWPAFNIADSAIFIGVVVLCIHSMFIQRKYEERAT